MIPIRADQVRQLESADLPEFEARVVSHVRQTFGGRARLLSDDEIRHAYCTLRPRAESHGFRSGHEVGLYTDYALMIGSGFDRDPLLPWVGPILDERSPERARLLYDGVMAHLDRFVRGHLVFPVLPVRRLRRTPCVTSDDYAPTAFDERDARELCHQLWPARANALDETTWSAFSAAVTEEVHRFDLATPAGLAMLTALCFVLGIEAARDPMLPMLGQAVARGQRHDRPAQRLVGIRRVVQETIDVVLPGASSTGGSR